MSETISQVAVTAQKDATAAVQQVESFFSSAAFHNHIRTWTFVVLAIFVMGFLYIHESNSNAANTAVAVQIDKSTKETQANLDKQIAVIANSTASQVQQLQAQQAQIQTVAQAMAAIRNNGPANMPPIVVNPIVTQPATANQPAVTTATDQAAGNTPVATLTGDDLKIMAQNTLVCKQDEIKLNACTQESALKDQKLEASENEVKVLKKVKLEPAWKKALKAVGQFCLGAIVGTAVSKGI